MPGGFFHIFLSLLLLAGSSTVAIEVTPDSGCSNFCLDQTNGNVSDTMSTHTFSRDLACEDWEYSGTNSTTVGRKFASCVGCEQTSAAYDTASGENDVYWFLFNIKASISWCIFGLANTEPNPNSNPIMNACSTACMPLESGITYQLFASKWETQYDYCDSTFDNNVDACSKCLSNVPSARIINNYFSALKSACAQKPGTGQTIDLSLNVFDKQTGVSSTTTLQNQPTSTSTSMSTSTSSTPTTSNDSTNKSSSDGSSLAVKVGASLGTVAGVFILSLLFIWWWRRRRNRAWDTEDIQRFDPAQSYQYPQDYHYHMIEMPDNTRVAELTNEVKVGELPT